MEAGILYAKLRPPRLLNQPSPAFQTTPTPQETEALEAQEAANRRAPGDAAAAAATGSAAAPAEAAGALPHAAPANELDEAIARDGGGAAYKQLLGAGMNASHLPGVADGDGGAGGGEDGFETVADRVNFEVGVFFERGLGGMWRGWGKGLGREGRGC